MEADKANGCDRDGEDRVEALKNFTLSNIRAVRKNLKQRPISDFLQKGKLL